MVTLAEKCQYKLAFQLSFDRCIKPTSYRRPKMGMWSSMTVLRRETIKMIRKHLSIWFKALNCDSFVQETDWKISLEATAKKTPNFENLTFETDQSQPLFLYLFSSFLMSEQKIFFFAWWLDSNPVPLLQEATALPAALHSLPHLYLNIYFPASYNQFQDTLKTFLVRALLLALYRVWDDPKLWDICCLKLARFIFKNRSSFQYCFMTESPISTYLLNSFQLFNVHHNHAF